LHREKELEKKEKERRAVSFPFPTRGSCQDTSTPSPEYINPHTLSIINQTQHIAEDIGEENMITSHAGCVRRNL